jgi:hypothetical protein
MSYEGCPLITHSSLLITRQVSKVFVFDLVLIVKIAFFVTLCAC